MNRFSSGWSALAVTLVTGCALWTCAASAAGSDLSPVADRSAVVVCGKARFTVLTDRLLRLEYSPDARFEDRASLVFVNRRLPVPAFTTARTPDGRGVTVDTGRVRLTYAGGAFARDTLSVELLDGPLAGTAWRFGDEDRENLLGTTRTLDNVSRRTDLMARMEKGILSRGGWAVVDDSASYLFEPVASHWQAWVTPRPTSSAACAEPYRDLYVFAYGRAYREALGDYVKVAGRIPLPPRWAFGYWWSRYWQYSDEELKQLVRTIDDQGLPLDVLVVDMDWHETWGLGENGGFDEFGQRNGWSGYTWKRQLFPDPKGFLDWCHDRGLKTSLNLHPASGVQPLEACYAAFCADYGWESPGRAVPFKIDEEKWADSYFRTVLGPLERDGVDFWWLDWQQWLTSKWNPGLSNTFWLNHTFDRHAAERDPSRRPMIYHRWGGLGSHRYQTGFSGDTAVSWDVLRLLPWFTATSGNVGYGYWGHDVGGHHWPNGLGRDGELFTRWLQSTVFQPLFKTHYGRTTEIERRVWAFPAHQAMMKAAIRQRYAFAPYIYTAARQAYDTGVSMCRPLYYDWPEADEAYDPTLPECLFGEDLLAVTVATPAEKETQLAPVTMWLPPGSWYDLATGDLLAGGRTLTRAYVLAENPCLAKAGAVLPLNPEGVRNLKSTPGTLAVMFVPGAEGGRTALYEDDGEGSDYAARHATTEISWRKTEREIVATVGARRGDYAGAPSARRYELRFPCQMPPLSVAVNGAELPWSREPRPGTWSYDGRLPGVVVATESLPVDAPTHARLAYDPADLAAGPKLAGLRGFLNRADLLTQEMKAEYNQRVNVLAMLPDCYLNLACLGSALSARPAEARRLLAEFAADRAAFGERFAPVAEKLSGAFVRRLTAWMAGAGSVPDGLLPAGAELYDLRADVGLGTEGAGAVPAFSWKTRCPDGRRAQEAYRLRVRRADDGSTVWDSGVVFDSHSVARPCPGPALGDVGALVWDVTTRDGHGQWTPVAEGRFSKAPRDGAAFFARQALTFETDSPALDRRWKRCRAAGAAAGVSPACDQRAFRSRAQYAVSGDRRLLDAGWPSMCEALTVPPEGDFMAQCRYVLGCWYLKEVANCRGDRAAENRFALAERDARERIARTFCDARGRLKEELDRQDALALALKIRLFKSGSDAKEDLCRRLVARLRRAPGRLTVEPACADLLPGVLTEDAQRPDLVYSLLLEEPENGDALPADEVAEWLCQVAAGIRPGDLRETPGYKEFALKPIPDRRVGRVSAVLDSPYGAIESSWRFDAAGNWHWHYVIPSNTRAVVRVPGAGTVVRPAGSYDVTLPPERLQARVP